MKTRREVSFMCGKITVFGGLNRGTRSIMERKKVAFAFFIPLPSGLFFSFELQISFLKVRCAVLSQEQCMASFCEMFWS